MSNIISTQVHNQVGPGILTVTLHEANGLSAAVRDEEEFNARLSQSTKHQDRSKSPWLGRTYQPYHQQYLPYAVLHFDHSETFAGSIAGTTENPIWAGRAVHWKFDVSRSSKLTLHLYVKSPHASEGGREICLGVVTLCPAFEDAKSPLGPQWLEIEIGTGRISIEVEYCRNLSPETGTVEHVHFNGPRHLGAVDAWRKRDTQQLYALRTIKPAQSLRFNIDNSFIVPVRLASQSPEGLHIFLPFVTGGHLFYHLQRQQCFDTGRSRLYAGEILCALDHLHELDIVYHGLELKNILLNSYGHIAIADHHLYVSDTKDEKSNSTGTALCPAPEVLLGQGYCEQSDWWTLGTILHEMLTGLPPFYDQHVDEVHRKIVSEPLQLPGSLSMSAKDVLTRLLNRDPEQRLGKAGVSEIKSHPFFDGLDWDKLAQRECEPAFKPTHIVTIFKEHRAPPFSETLKQFSGFTFNRPGNDTNKGKGLIAPMQAPAKGFNGTSVALSQGGTATGSFTTVNTAVIPEATESIQQAVDESHERDLIWGNEEQAFFLLDRVTNAKHRVATRREYPKQMPRAINRTIFDSVPATHCLHGHKKATQAQKEDVLEVALKSGYTQVVRQLLDDHGGMDLDIHVLRPWQTPLMWATDQESLDLVNIFLAYGADPSFTFASTEYKAAITIAVEKKNRQVVEILVHKTTPVLCTGALGLVVDQEDVELAALLLANGVKCDFGESDIPPYPGPNQQGCLIDNISYPVELTPPLVRAVKVGNVELVRLLLTHGADPNTGFHDIPQELPGCGTEFKRPSMRCGRVAQLAMDLGRQHVVQLLLEHGADISLAQHNWRHHECAMIPRDVYFKIVAGLRAEAMARKQ